MIEIVAEQLAGTMRELSFISLAGGVARAQKVKDGDGAGVKTLPAVLDQENNGSYIWMTPDSKQSGIAYFENLGNDLVDGLSGGNRGQMYKATLRVVVWLNLDRITPPITGAMMAQVVASLSAGVGDTDFVKSVRVVPIKEVPRTAEIFSKYTYNEAEMQYLMLPYDYFAFDFDVRYILVTNCHKVNFMKKDPSC